MANRACMLLRCCCNAHACAARCPSAAPHLHAHADVFVLHSDCGPLDAILAVELQQLVGKGCQPSRRLHERLCCLRGLVLAGLCELVSPAALLLGCLYELLLHSRSAPTVSRAVPVVGLHACCCSSLARPATHLALQRLAPQLLQPKLCQLGPHVLDAILLQGLLQRLPGRLQRLGCCHADAVSSSTGCFCCCVWMC